MSVVFVRGVGDIGSAVALALRRAGHAVLLHDRPKPAYTRRAVAFADVLFDGKAAFDGLSAKRARVPSDVPYMLDCGRALPASDDPLDQLLARVRPDVVVDARMRKRSEPQSQRDIAPLSIGLGPGFVAGEHVDAVIETANGAELGNIITSGKAQPLAGEPTPLGGAGRERFVYATVAGTFRSGLLIGARVESGREVGFVGTTVVRAPLTGWLRGLTHDGAEVEAGTKIVEIDPSATPDAVFRIGERAQCVAAAVLAAIERSH